MKNSKTRSLVIMGILTALMLIFSFTPIGTIPIGPLSISLNVIPVAIAAVVLGPAGGAAAGAIFGMLSFLQCFGIGIPSGMGAALVAINPFLAFVQRFIPRLLDGLLVGLLFRAVSKKNSTAACFVTGFFSAFLNTLFFMSALVLLFGNTEYIQGLMDAKGTHNVFLFICLFVGVNAVCEMIVSTLLTGAIGTALIKARVIPSSEKPAAAHTETV
ncbi:MAG: ECF transporter S component [Oscillospiraceae bacterium]|nr:ECF transporter S component [Oscillospiraceae bacterium]